jgi:hypothetical protein
MDPKQSVLTASRLSALRRCPRSHYYRYELGLIRDREQQPLRMGSAFHLGQQVMGTWRLTALADDDREPVEQKAILQATAGYDQRPAYADPADWEIERVTVANLLAGHFWRYSADDLEIVAVEFTFEIPLVNPATGAPSRTFVLAGKIDAIVRLPDARLAVLEFKTAGEDIGPDSKYWLRLRCDPQISQYYLAAQAVGYAVTTVLYDVSRKPSIGPRTLPILDAKGFPIVLDQAGKRVFTKQGKPRQTASAADGYELQSRPETPDEFGERFLTDIAARPDFYYARREVPRLTDELEAFSLELWQQAQYVAETRRRAAKLARPASAWFRSVGRFTCDGCQFADLCLQSIDVGPQDVPQGYVKVDDPHTELS